DLVSVIATGGEVEGFAGTVSFPDAVTITMPANGAPLTLDRSAGFPIAWQAFVAPDAGADTDAGDLAPPVPDVTVVIEQSGAAGTVSVRCNFPASQATSATVPADALSDLAATTNGAPATTVHVGAHVGDDA